MRGRSALLVLNGGKPPERIEAARAELIASGLHLEEVACDDAEAACGAISRGAAAADLVIVAGGDGTLNGAAPALLDCRKPLGILPCGTANDLARTLAIPADPLKAAQVILAGDTRRIDLGMANERPFFNVASLGLAADLAEVLDEGHKQRFGRLSYGLAALRVLARAKPFRAAVAAHGQIVRLSSYQIAVGNGRFHGGGMAVREDARIDDGQLSLYSLGPGSLWKAVVLAPLFRRGRHVRWREVMTARAGELEIRTAQPVPVNLDGELCTETPLQLKVLPGAIEVFAPPAA